MAGLPFGALLLVILSGRYRCENAESGSDRVRRARHSVKSLQMAPLSWRHYPVVRAVVPEVPDLVCAHGRDGARTWPVHLIPAVSGAGSKSMARNWISAAALT